VNRHLGVLHAFRGKYFWTLSIAVAVVLAGLAVERAAVVDLDRLRVEPSRIFVDRQGGVLRFATNGRGERHVETPLEDIPEHVRQAFVAAEDERFFSHPGFDVPAVLRALRDNLRAGRIVSGASTITQQLCRLAYPRKRTVHHKLLEVLRSVRLETALSKQEILGLYLNRVPLGNNLIGVETAARVYFGKHCSALSPAEAALLAALPKAPELLNPYGNHAQQLLTRQAWVLERMQRLGMLAAEEYATAKRQVISFEPRDSSFQAGHLVDYLLSKQEVKATQGEIRATIDATLQQQVERTLLSHRPRLVRGGATQAAAVVMANHAGDVLAMVGSLAYSRRDQGFNNGATALRSPGSALKPFLYALALDTGLTAATVLEDVPRSYRSPRGEYVPINFDRKSYGPASLREALGNSLNLSAVHVLNGLGYFAFYSALERLQLINHPERGPDHYGLGLVLGNPELSLVQLVSAYACLANGGAFRPARLLAGGAPSQEYRVFSPQASWIISHILADPAARALSFSGSAALNFPYRVAVKTGTSTHYRDSWTVAYTPEYTLGVWVGNFDGHPTHKLSGAVAAAPILADLMQHLYRLGPPPAFPMVEGVRTVAVCSYSGMKPCGACPHVKVEVFIAGSEPADCCSFHRHGELLHELPARYAGWLHERYERGTEGRYRLMGFDHDLDKAFRTQSGEDKISREAPEGRVAGAKLQVLNHQVTLGQPADDGGPRPGTPASRCHASIIYPLDRDHFLLDPTTSAQTITLKALSDEPLQQLTWFVDGVEYARSAPPYEAEWELVPGRHHLTVTGDGCVGDGIAVEVE
jgi:penicillin-binding protein 1C